MSIIKIKGGVIQRDTSKLHGKLKVQKIIHSGFVRFGTVERVEKV